MIVLEDMRPTSGKSNKCSVKLHIKTLAPYQTYYYAISFI